MAEPDWAATLEEGLNALAQSFTEHGKNNDARLHAYAAAVGLVVMHLNRMPEFAGDTLVLEDLLLRLSDMMAGTNAIRPVKVKGRPPQGWRDAIIQGRASATVQMLMDNGFAEPEACDLVANALARAGKHGRRGDLITGKTVRDWRSRCGRYGDKSDARSIFENTLSNLKQAPLATMSRRSLASFAKAFVVGTGSSTGQVLIKSPLSE